MVLLLPHRRINECRFLERLNVLGTVAHGATHLHETGALPLVPPRSHGERRDAKALGNFRVREDSLIDPRKILFGLHGGYSFLLSTEVPDRVKSPSSCSDMFANS
jgi:hypothetical protein